MFDWNAYEKRMAWYVHDRFGMFIHWGLYAIPARGEWVRSTEEIPKEDYMRYFREFNPVDYDPKQWARAAKEAGMKYVVLTAKHHDGFCLWDTQTTDFKAPNTPAGRDLIREYVDAVRAEGLKVGLYYSIIDWYHEDFPHYGDRNHPMRNHPECGNEHRDFNRYLAYMHEQVRELCSNYGKLDILWFDFSYDNLRGEAWKATQLVEMVRSLQPEVIIDNTRYLRVGEGYGSLASGNPTPYHGDFVSPEQMIPPEGIRDVNGRPIPWEACVTMNNHWGFCGTDTEFKPAPCSLRSWWSACPRAATCFSTWGRTPGEYPEQSLEILQEMGRWMRKNSASIYGCGRAEDGQAGLRAHTRKGSLLYYHVYENSIGPLHLPGLSQGQVKKIRLLATGQEVPVSHAWMHSDYPGLVFADWEPTPSCPTGGYSAGSGAGGVTKERRNWDDTLWNHRDGKNYPDIFRGGAVSAGAGPGGGVFPQPGKGSIFWGGIRREGLY